MQVGPVLAEPAERRPAGSAVGALDLVDTINEVSPLALVPLRRPVEPVPPPGSI